MSSLAIALSMSSAARAGLAPLSPVPRTAPLIQTCNFIPDPRTNTSFSCGDSNAPSAFVNVSVFFQVNVSDASNNNMSVTFSFDYLIPNGTNPPEVNPTSPVRTINVSSPGAGLPVSVNTTWTYATPNANFTGGQYYVNASVRNDLGEFDPGLGMWLFPVYVSVNSPPYIDGFSSFVSVSPSIRPQNPVVPLVYENVTVGDPDFDPVTLTWVWGDGNRTVSKVDTSSGPAPVSVTHQYAVRLFPLNQSPRYVDIPVVVWIDDGLGHNSSQNSTFEFYIDFDSPPIVRITLPVVGSMWKVGEPVRMVGNVTDPEGDPITAYWDFDNRTDSTNTGDPTRNQDALGTTATHTYFAPGNYSITLWATDGNKELCLSANCANFTTHWRSAVQPITVRYDLPPVLALTNASTIAGHPLLLRASVYDPEGDNMTVRWVFGDGSPDGTNVTGNSSRASPMVFQVFQTHNYTEPGNQTLTVSVSDGNVNNTVKKTVQVMVQSFNLPPVILQVHVYRANGTSAGNNSFPVNATVELRVETYDPENDTLNVSVDWADGGSENQTIEPKRASECALDLGRNICTVSFQHVYASIGSDLERNYTVVVTVTDNQVYFGANLTGGPPITADHTQHQSIPITITNYVAAGAVPWNSWDYSTLAIVLGVPAFLIARFAWKVRRERAEA